MIKYVAFFLTFALSLGALAQDSTCEFIYEQTDNFLKDPTPAPWHWTAFCGGVTTGCAALAVVPISTMCSVAGSTAYECKVIGSLVTVVGVGLTFVSGICTYFVIKDYSKRLSLKNNALELAKLCKEAPLYNDDHSQSAEALESIKKLCANKNPLFTSKNAEIADKLTKAKNAGYFAPIDAFVARDLLGENYGKDGAPNIRDYLGDCTFVGQFAVPGKHGYLGLEKTIMFLIETPEQLVADGKTFKTAMDGYLRCVTDYNAKCSEADLIRNEDVPVPVGTQELEPLIN